MSYARRAVTFAYVMDTTPIGAGHDGMSKFPTIDVQ
jgi:hypothetical protein